jgi:hypothetical protein
VREGVTVKSKPYGNSFTTLAHPEPDTYKEQERSSLRKPIPKEVNDESNDIAD